MRKSFARKKLFVWAPGKQGPYFGLTLRNGCDAKRGRENNLRPAKTFELIG